MTVAELTDGIEATMEAETLKQQEVDDLYEISTKDMMPTVHTNDINRIMDVTEKAWAHNLETYRVDVCGRVEKLEKLFEDAENPEESTAEDDFLHQRWNYTDKYPGPEELQEWLGSDSITSELLNDHMNHAFTILIRRDDHIKEQFLKLMERLKFSIALHYEGNQGAKSYFFETLKMLSDNNRLLEIKLRHLTSWLEQCEQKVADLTSELGEKQQALEKLRSEQVTPTKSKAGSLTTATGSASTNRSIRTKREL